jgi:hypothetical protein
MPPLEYALRSATVAVLVLTGVIILRDRRHRESGGLGGRHSILYVRAHE